MKRFKVKANRPYGYGIKDVQTGKVHMLGYDHMTKDYAEQLCWSMNFVIDLLHSESIPFGPTIVPELVV